ncbi:sugar phosphate isomerase/epimerase family protein [Kineosporia sp. NBRC 101731]|uniref:sugar phosphate isomerase/epimerase family protein n=1 Tax=Kineosporia sp. NBRC 101731 TaxID=3032199 RepID=UPI0024A08CF9|nr:sugar phosphate isomerase/epimerase family protein [Kineosporia sp. NBRC 101731]GLY31614.1 hypothetical protein Kisp02_49790 [Kineosporia sp. NBRC 101731]
MSLQIALATGPSPLEETFPRVAEEGLSGLEFSCQHAANRPERFDAERLTLVADLLDQHDFSAVLHTDSAVNVAEITPGVREAVAEHLTGYVDLAEGLGCPVVIVHGGYWFGDDREARVEQAARTLGRAARYAAERGITLALENMNELPTTAEIRYLGCTADEVLTILDLADSPALTACADLGHANLLPGGAPAFVEQLKGRIGHVQLTDNDGVIDHHLALGEGTLDVAAALDALAATGYDAQVAIELDSPDAQTRSLTHLREKAPHHLP